MSRPNYAKTSVCQVQADFPHEMTGMATKVPDRRGSTVMQCCLCKQLNFSVDKLDSMITADRTVTNHVTDCIMSQIAFLLIACWCMPDRAMWPEQLKLDRENLTTYLISKGRLCVDQLCALSSASASSASVGLWGRQARTCCGPQTGLPHSAGVSCHPENFVMVNNA